MVLLKQKKKWNKNEEGEFLRDMMVPMAASLIASMGSFLIQPVASSWKNAVTGTRQEGGFLSLIALPLINKVLEEDLEEHNEDMITWIK